MTAVDPANRPAVAAIRVTSGGISQDIRAIKVVMAREWIRFRQDKIRMISALVQPVPEASVFTESIRDLSPGMI